MPAHISTVEKEVYELIAKLKRISSKTDEGNNNMTPHKIAIDNEVYEVDDIHDCGYLTIIRLDDGTEWYIAQDSEQAGEKAREYWEDMARNDREELISIIGKETFISWALGEFAGPGSAKVEGLEAWLDLWLDVPEEQWSGYDGTERDCRISRSLQEEISLRNKCVCYRHN